MEQTEETHKNPYLEGFSTVIMNDKARQCVLSAKTCNCHVQEAKGKKKRRGREDQDLSLICVYTEIYPNKFK